MSKKNDEWTVVEKKKSNYVKTHTEPRQEEKHVKKPLYDVIPGQTKKNTIGGSTEKKYNAGHNKQRQQTVSNKSLDDVDEDDFSSYQVQYVPKEIGQRIAQLRAAKQLSQGDLAKAINEKTTVVIAWENGSAVLSSQIQTKIEKALGKKLK